MLALQSCFILPGKGKNTIVFNLKNQPKKVTFNPSLASIDITNDIVTINGSGFSKVTEVKIQGTGVDVSFNLDSLSDSKIIASAKSALALLVGSTFNLIISSAEASSTFPITFTLSDGVVTNTKLHSMGAQPGEVLQFNGTNWLPASIASPMLFIGMWDASSGSPTAGAYSAGDYFIVSGAGTYGTDNYVVGDWAVYDGADWNRVFTDTGTKLSKTGGTLTGDLILDTQALFKGGANYVTIKASAGLASDITLTLPTSVGTNGQVLTTNGSGVLSWETVASGGGTGAVYSVNSQTGTVTLTTSDIAEGSNQYFTTARALSAVTASLATKQSVDTTLTSLAAYNTNGILVQTAADTFVGRTLTGTANRLTVTDGNGVAGNPTVDIDTSLLPSPSAGNSNQFLMATGANTASWTTPPFISNSGETINSGTFDFSGGTAVIRVADPSLLTDVANKQYVDAAITGVSTASNTWTASGSDIYRLTGNVGIGTASTAAATLDIGGPMGNVQFTDGRTILFTRGFDNYITAINGASSSLTIQVMNELKLKTGGSERIRILSNGDVGIGTTSPTASLTVNGEMRTLGSTNGYVGFQAAANTSSQTYTWPESAGVNGQVLTTTGTGALTWATVSGGSGAVYSVNAQTGTVTLTTSDIAEGSNQYFTTARALSAVTASLAAKQDLDTTLTSLAAYNTNGILVQTAADTFVGRSIANTASRTVVTNGDGVSGNPTIDVDTSLLPSPSAGNANQFLMASGANTSTWTTPNYISKAGDTITSGTFAFGGSALITVPTPLTNTEVANKQYVDITVATASNSWTASGTDIYRSSGYVGIGTSTPQGIFEVQGGTAAAATEGSDITLVAQAGGAGTIGGGDINLTTGAGSGGWQDGAVNINLGSGNPGVLNIMRGRGSAYTATGTSFDNYPGSSGIKKSNSYNADGNYFIEATTVNNSTPVMQAGYFGFVSTTGATNYSPAAVWGRGTSATTYAETMRIDHNGNVGIGTAAPTASLTVNGEMRTLGSSSGYVGFKAAASTSSTTYTWPTTSGTSSYVLSTDGTGTLSWIAQGGGLNATLTALSSYNTNGIMVQTAANTFTGRTLTGTASRTVVTNGDGVAGNPTIDIDTSLFPSPVAGNNGHFFKATGANTATWTALASSDVTTALGFTPINKAGDTISGTLTFTSGNFTIGQSAFLVVPNPVLSTDAVNKQYVDGLLGATWTASGSDAYRASGYVGIGTSTPQGTFEVQGGTAAANTAGSDISLVAQAAGAGVGNGGGAINLTTGAPAGGWAYGAVNINLGTVNPGMLNISRGRGATYSASGSASGNYPGSTAIKKSNSSNADGNHFIEATTVNNSALNIQAGYFGYVATTGATNYSPATVWGRGTSATTYTETMRIDQNGNLGIGTTAPTASLTVAGTASISGATVFGNSVSIGTTLAVSGLSMTLGTMTFEERQASFPSAILLGISNNGNYGSVVVGRSNSTGAAGGGLALGISNSVSWDDGVALGRSNTTTTQGSVAIGIGVSNSTTNSLMIGPSDAAKMTILSSGNVGIGNAAPGYKLDVTGDISASGCLRSSAGIASGACVSDERLKTNIHSFTLGLDALLGITPRYYKYNGLGGLPMSKEDELGVVAQEIEKAAPILVTKKQIKLHATDEKTTEIKQVNYTALIYVVINAIKDFYHRWMDDSAAIHRDIASKADQSELDALKTKTKKLEEENAQMKAELKEIKKILLKKKHQ